MLRERVQLLYRQSFVPALAGVPFGLFLLVLLWDALPHPLLLTWFALKVAATLIRVLLHRGYDRSGGANPDAWLRRYTWALGFDGLAWTFLGVAFARPDDVITMAITLCSLLGITAISAVVYALYFRALVVFSCSVMLPAALFQLYLANRSSLFAALGMLVFLALMIQNGRRSAKATDELLRMRFQLVEAHQDALSAAVAKAAAHDLAAPLIAITHLSHWIRDELDDEARAKVGGHLEKLGQRVERMQQLVQGIHEYASAGLGKRIEEPVAIGELAQEIFRGLPGSDAFDLSLGELPEVVTHRRSLATVLRTLVENAIEHHDEAKGSITIAAREAEQAVEISVSDDGPGIAARDRQRVFDLLRTLHRRDEKEGAGAGLAVAKKIVEARGGSIEVAPTDGRGTTISFTWPSRALDEDEPGT